MLPLFTISMKQIIVSVQYIGLSECNPLLIFYKYMA
jgi:hypothetical protein